MSLPSIVLRDLPHHVSTAVVAATHEGAVHLSTLQSELRDLCLNTLIPTFRERWISEAGSALDDHGQKMEITDLWAQLTVGPENAKTADRLIDLLCGAAADNKITRRNRQAMYDIEPLSSDLHEVISEFVDNGYLPETFSVRETESGYSGDLLGFSVCRFNPVLEIDPEFAHRSPQALDMHHPFRSQSLLIITDIRANTDEGQNVSDAFFHHVGNINYAQERESANTKMLMGAGIAMMFVRSGLNISAAEDEDGCRVYLGETENEKTLITDDVVFIGDRADVESALRPFVADPAAYVDGLIENGQAMSCAVPENGLMRTLVDDDLLMQAPQPGNATLILAAGQGPMPALGDLPAQPEDISPPGL